ncbi:MAG: polysaccharide biosynthesis tyrosine autokinase [Planctomycetota bacterium]|nr:polysaccharide biosynthesis tyrosine autokinase [Planctomycetota bacterium]
MLLHEQKLIYDEGKGNNHPEVINVRKGIETLTEFYRQRGIELPQRGPNGVPAAASEIDFVAVYLRSLQQQLLALEHRDAELTALYDKEELLARNHSKYQVKERILRDEIDRVQGLYDKVETQLDQLLHIRPNQSYSLKVVAPTKDELMVKRHLMFLAGGVAGCVGCIAGLIYLSLMRDTTLKTLDEIRRHLPGNVLGTIPDFDAEALPKADDPYAQWHPALCFLHQPGSHEAEAYRSLRAALLVSIQNQNLRVVQISSPEPSDGKSTVAANLALAASQSGKKVLLIDADLRRPTQHALFKLPHDIGLTEVLEKEIEVQNAIQTTTIPNLSVLTSGCSPANPAELLSSVRWDQMMMSIRSEYDLIIVDTPPVLAVSDPCIIAPRIDGLLLVVHLFKTTRSAILKARDLLETHHVRLLGSIANGQPKDSSDPYANLYYESYTPQQKRTPSHAATTTNGVTQRPAAGIAADS